MIVRDRQARLQATPCKALLGGDVATWRVRIGHALIVAGSSLSGERVERRAHPHAPARA